MIMEGIFAVLPVYGFHQWASEAEKTSVLVNLCFASSISGNISHTDWQKQRMLHEINVISLRRLAVT